MNSIYPLFFFSLFLLSNAFVPPLVTANPRRNSLQTNITMPKLPSNAFSVRQSAPTFEPLCPSFNLQYKDIRKPARFLMRRNAVIEGEKQKCDSCISCFNCDSERVNQLIEAANRCIAKYTWARCYVALSILGLKEDLSFGCTEYFKDSAIGNCYLNEYLVLNGVTSAGKLIYSREKGTYDDHGFQCRAGTRRNKPNLPNPIECRREPFSITYNAVLLVHVCANPGIVAASSQYSVCLGNPTGPFSHLFCFNNFIFDSARAFISCIVPHGLPAVAVASLSTGYDAITCPAFRRDSFVNQCKAGDFVALSRLDAIEYKNDNSYEVLIPDACSYA